jgi:alkaline phosphatase D
MRAEWGDPPPATTLFTLGVASGDPTSNSVVIWTRLAPDPLNGGGMGTSPVEVLWEVATDPGMQTVVRNGAVTANPASGHAVAVTVDGLYPDSWYYYQFSYAGERSRIGRTRTFPDAGSLPAELRFAVVSCQDFQAGYYAAYGDIARQDLAFVVHVGDYIYEDAADPDVPVERRHTGGETVSVDEYRNRYSLYRLDPQLQEAHAAFPFIVTWDDHEVDNNYAGRFPEDEQTVRAFLQRRANAYQVYREMMPLSPAVVQTNARMNLYRSMRFGSLAEFFVLDGRQMRTDQPCGDGFRSLQSCPEILDPAATMLGAAQEEWLFGGLAESGATWKVLAQQVMMMRWDAGVVFDNREVNIFNVDAWDGYQVARDRLMAFLASHGLQNVVVLTGDIHASWAADLKEDFTNPASLTVGAEFVCSGVTSGYGDALHRATLATIPENPHIRFFDGLYRGYVLCRATPERWQADYRAVERISSPVFTVPTPEAAVFTMATFALNAGQPGLHQEA